MDFWTVFLILTVLSVAGIFAIGWLLFGWRKKEYEWNAIETGEYDKPEWDGLHREGEE